MKYLIPLTLALLIGTAHAQNFGYNGQCSKGGQAVITQGLVSTATKPLPPTSGSPAVGTGVIGSYPSCLVNVYYTGTSNRLPIYSSASGGVLSNPFIANTDGSFYFNAPPAVGFDVTITGGGLPAPVTKTNIVLGGGGGGGGGGTVTSVGSGSGLTGGPIFTAGTLSLVVPVTRANGGLNSITPGVGILRDATTPTAS